MMRDRLIFVSFLLAAVINIVLWITLAGKFGLGREPVPLHFNVVQGIDFVGSSGQLYEIPLAGLVFIFINLILAKIMYRQEKLFSYFLSFASASAQLVFLLGVISLMVLSG